MSQEEFKIIYADNAATTKVDREVIDKMYQVLSENYGNPSSQYSVGRSAGKELISARETIAKVLGCTPREIYFTSGGSESDNQALISGAVLGSKEGRKHLISSKIEHHAILRTLEKLEADGYEVTLLDVGEDGIISPDDLRNAIRPDTAIVSIMTANNEIGTLQPIKELAAITHEAGAIFHTDAVQAVGHIGIDLHELDVDMLSASAHKFNGPKGVGLLYAKRGLQLVSLINGGAQERGKRAGTENVAGIAGLALALDKASKCVINGEAERVRVLRDRLIDKVLELPEVYLNGDREQRLPGNASFCIRGVEGESLLILLDRKGICASAGSACSSGSLEPSHVLLAIGRDAELARGALRISLSAENTEEEVDRIAAVLKESVDYLRSAALR